MNRLILFAVLTAFVWSGMPIVAHTSESLNAKNLKRVRQGKRPKRPKKLSAEKLEKIREIGKAILKTRALAKDGPRYKKDKEDIKALQTKLIQLRKDVIADSLTNEKIDFAVNDWKVREAAYKDRRVNNLKWLKRNKKFKASRMTVMSDEIATLKTMTKEEQLEKIEDLLKRSGADGWGMSEFERNPPKPTFVTAPLPKGIDLLPINCTV